MATAFYGWIQQTLADSVGIRVQPVPPLRPYALSREVRTHADCCLRLMFEAGMEHADAVKELIRHLGLRTTTPHHLN